MNPRKWEQLVYLAEEKFGIENRVKEEFELDELSDGKKIMGEKESFEFKSPLGRIKVEKISRPKVMDKKVLHTKRIGGRVAIDFVYSPDEKVSEMKIYCEKNGNWEEANLDEMGIS